MAFDTEGARQAGYSDAEIADHLASQTNFDVAGARKAGYSDSEIVQHLSAPTEAPKPSEGPSSTPSSDTVDPQVASTLIKGVKDKAQGQQSALLEGLYRGGIEGPAEAGATLLSAGNQALGIGADDPQAALKAAVTNRRQEWAKHYEKVFGEAPNTAVIGAGQIAPLLALPTGKADTVLGTIGQALKVGAAASSITYTGASGVVDKIKSTALGALASAAIAGSISAVFNVPGLIARKWAAMTNPAQEQAAQELGNFIPGMDKEMTMAQQSGNPQLKGVESQVSGSYAQRQYQKQADLLKQKLETIRDQYGPRLTADVAAQRGQAAVRNEVSRLSSNRKVEWDSMLGAAQDAVTAEKITGPAQAGTAQDLIPVPDFGSKMIEDAQKFGIPVDRLSPGIKAAINEVETFKGKISAESLIKLLKNLNDETTTIAPGMAAQEQKALARSIKNSVFSQLDQVTDQNASEAVTWIKRARQNYAERSSQIGMFRRSAVARTLGLKDFNGDPAAALDSIRNMSADAQTQARDLLYKQDPQLLNSMRAKHWQDILDAGVTNTRDVTEGSIDPARIVDAALDGDKLKASGLYSDTDARLLSDGMKAVRALLYSQGVSGKAPQVEQAAMSVVSRAPAFVTRTLFQALKLGDKALFTPEGRAILRSVRGTMGTPQAAKAVESLMAYAIDPAPEDE